MFRYKQPRSVVVRCTHPIHHDPRARPLRFERLEARAMLSVNGDFDGDGFDDLAIGAPFENVGDISNAGAVSVIYGSRKGLAATNNQFWHQNVSGIDGAAATSDQFGYALAAGDFNGDGFDDLAVGVPFKTVNGKGNAGAVNVLYGSSTGLRAVGDQLWTQDSPGINDAADGDNEFGSTLAAGDFNDDGRDDLAIGVPRDTLGAIPVAGAVNVIYGSSNGLTNANDQHWHQNSAGINDIAEAGDFFGGALAAGDFNGDGRDDLAIGARFEDIGGVQNAGAASVIYGSNSGLTGSGDQFWHQDSPGVIDDAEAFDFFGTTLAAGDFNGDGRDDLAIGVPGEALGAIASAGRVNVLYGSVAKLTVLGNAQYNAAVLGFTLQENTSFGQALAAGDFDGDGHDDLAIGAPFENIETAFDAGATYMVYGSASGLTATGTQRWIQGFGPTGTLLDSPETSDHFGIALAAGDYNGDGHDDLGVGVRNEPSGALPNVGAVSVLYGFFVSGLFNVGNQLWHQDLLSSSDGNEAGDNFGYALG